MRNNETVIIMPNIAGTRRVAESVAVVLCQAVAESGGYAWARWVRNALVVRIQRVAKAWIRRTVGALTEGMVQQKLSLTFFQMPADAVPLPRRQLTGTLVTLKLSRWLLLCLPVGTYVSSSASRTGCSRFSVRLGQKQNREPVWRQALKASAANRLCHISWKPESRGHDICDSPRMAERPT